MNAAPILQSGTDGFGRKRARAMEGLWVGQAGQERAW